MISNEKACEEKYELPICERCSHLNNGCNIQNTVCLYVARKYPSSLITKTLNNIMYELKLEK